MKPRRPPPDDYRQIMGLFIITLVLGFAAWALLIYVLWEEVL